MIEQNIQVGVDYFRGEYISYASGYLLFGLIAGFVFGSLGAALARRQMTDHRSQRTDHRGHIADDGARKGKALRSIDD